MKSFDRQKKKKKRGGGIWLVASEVRVRGSNWESLSDLTSCEREENTAGRPTDRLALLSEFKMWKLESIRNTFDCLTFTRIYGFLG